MLVFRSLKLKSLLDDKWMLTDTFENVEYAWRQGRISNDQWFAYVFIWTWGTSRFGGVAGFMQDMYFDRFGTAALDTRRSRVRRWIAAAKKLDAQK